MKNVKEHYLLVIKFCTKNVTQFEISGLWVKKFKNDFLVVMNRADLRGANETVQDPPGAKFAEL